MVAFLQEIVNSLSTCFSIIINVIKAAANFIAMLPNYIAYATDLFGLMPTFILSFLLAGFFIALLLLILGRC